MVNRSGSDDECLDKIDRGSALSHSDWPNFVLNMWLYMENKGVIPRVADFLYFFR